jgi:hypothetical protein
MDFNSSDREKADSTQARRMKQSKATKPRGKSTPPAQRKLAESSQSARDRAFHVLAAMRRNPKLSLAHAAKLEGVKQETVKRYFPSALKKSGGKFRVLPRDSYKQILYVPDVHGNAVPVTTHSSRERAQLSRYLRDLGRYLRGDRDALARWHGKKVGGLQLLTSERSIVNIEPALSEFALYRTFNGGSR